MMILRSNVSKLKGPDRSEHTLVQVFYDEEEIVFFFLSKAQVYFVYVFLTGDEI